MKNRGFTLIELLAVLTILAIIALIVIPIVSGIIKDSRIESRKRSIDMYGRALEQAIGTESMKRANDDLTYSDYETIINNLEYSGESKVECNITINDDGTVYLNNCKVDGKEVKNHTYGKKKLVCVQ